jgi:hypothetical protein
VSPCDHNSDNADQKCNGEEHSARLGEPKPVTEPPPIASDSSHARTGRRCSDGGMGQRAGMSPERCARASG